MNPPAIRAILWAASLAAPAAAGEMEEVPLGDVPIVAARQGWGSLRADRDVAGATPLRIGDRAFARGLGTSGSGELTFDLGGEFERFEAWVGVDASMLPYRKGSVEFVVVADGRELFRSGVMRPADGARRVSVPVAGACELKLYATDGGDGIECDHADWAEPVLVRARRAREVARTVESGGLRLGLSGDGRIIDGNGILAGGRAGLGGFREDGPVEARGIPGGGIEYVRPVRSPASGRTVALRERFVPIAGGIRWELEVPGDGAPWSAPVRFAVKAARTDATRFWTTWIDGSPAAVRPAAPAGGDPAAPAPLPDGKAWVDPLVPAPFAPGVWAYGGGAGTICIPLASALDPASDSGATIFVPVDRPLLQHTLSTSAGGWIVFAFGQHRLGGGRPAVFAVELTAHEADWRGGLRRVVDRHPAFFDPPNPRAGDLGGTASYSSRRGKFSEEEAARLRKKAYRWNWVASFDWPTYGIFLPPMRDDDEEWKSAGHDSPGNPTPALVRSVSFRSMNAECRAMKDAGFHALSYFLCTEFGSAIGEPGAVRADLAEKDWWRDATTYLYRRMPGAILGPKVLRSWSGSVVMDPGIASFQAHVLEQARRHVERLPDSDGICIDRLDWLQWVNFAPGADDGAGWYDPGKPGRFLARGWIDLLSKLGPLMHGAGKLIFVNPCLYGHRLELMREVDGFFDEYGDQGYAMNGTSLLALRKPAAMWTHGKDDIRPDVDAYFGRHLYLGAAPTCPFPGNDHCIGPDPAADRAYLDYGPLLDALRGKRWVLAPHAIEVTGGAAKANLFEVPGGWAAAVALGGTATSAAVTIRNVPGLGPGVRCETLHPGVEKPQPVAASWRDGRLELAVPLVRGCAVVRIAKADDRPVGAATGAFRDEKIGTR